MTMPNGPKWCCTLFSLGYDHHRNCERVTMCNDCERFNNDTETIYCDDCYDSLFDDLDC